jgi:hypothetical protein
MDPSEPGSVTAPVPQVCQRCRQTFPGDPTLLPGAMIEWWACDACRTVLGLSVTDTDPTPSTTTCWYVSPSHQPSMGCPRQCNGAPVASELITGGGRRLYCESHWYWRKRDAPTALLQRL